MVNFAKGNNIYLSFFDAPFKKYKCKYLVLRGHSVIRTCGDFVLSVCLSVMNISTLMVNRILTIVVNNTYSQFLVSLKFAFYSVFLA